MPHFIYQMVYDARCRFKKWGIALFCLRLSAPCIDHYHGLSPMASYNALSGLGAFSNPIKNKRMLLRFVPHGCNMHIRKHQGATKTPIFPKSLLSLGMIEKRPKARKGRYN